MRGGGGPAGRRPTSDSNAEHGVGLMAGLGKKPVQFFFDIARPVLGVFASLDRF
jgi:hypothetical protein